MQEPILHSILSVESEPEPDVYIVTVDLTDMEGFRYVTEYVSRPDDNFGLAPAIRAALADWKG